MPLADLVDDVPEILKNWPTEPLLFHRAPGALAHLWSLDSVLRREIQGETGCLVHVNAYLTPPGAQGLKYHYDPYVTLIVQLSGRKAWPLHPPFVENPMTEHGNFLERGFTREERHHLAHTAPVRTFTLEPGDVFWLPRGFVHSPYAVGHEPSLEPGDVAELARQATRA
ncbi:cupin domain-containing protein [Streptomyces sp. NPDC094032]|uniref:JmjC domain-containing protein n=1 Tax=Streptomyces sp. NPDC094032 TaxID=3155308 RepID=UPI00332389C9